VEIRNALFTTAVPAHFFEMSQAELKNVNNNFIWFNPNIRDRYKEKIQQKKYIDSLIQLNLKDNDLVKQLVLHFSKNGSEAPGDCGKFSDDLVKNMEWLNTETGKGCCSDHSQVLIAYSLLANINTREVHNIAHTFNEYYDRQLKKWVWIDPQYCLMAKDSNNNYLSLLEIQNSFKNNITPKWKFFGTEIHTANSVAPELINNYFSKPAFEVIRMTLGNNVFTVDSVNQKLNKIPRNIRQLYLLTMKKQPQWVYHSSENKINYYFKLIKYTFFTFISSWFILNIFLIYRLTKF